MTLLTTTKNYQHGQSSGNVAAGLLLVWVFCVLLTWFPAQANSVAFNANNNNTTSSKTTKTIKTTKTTKTIKRPGPLLKAKKRLAVTLQKMSEKNQLALANVPKIAYKGITIVAFPASPGKPLLQPELDNSQIFANIRMGYDYLVAKSPYAAKTLKLLKASGPVWIFFSPSFPKQKASEYNTVTFAGFNPSMLVRKDGGKSYAVIMGHHLIRWPKEELAWALGHELIGHGMQHFKNRLNRSRLKSVDLECEAFLHQERVLQELGLWKNSDLIVKVRRQMEDNWCQPFINYINRTNPNKMKLWNERDLDIPQLLAIFNRYLLVLK